MARHSKLLKPVKVISERLLCNPKHSRGVICDEPRSAFLGSPRQPDGGWTGECASFMVGAMRLWRTIEEA